MEAPKRYKKFSTFIHRNNSEWERTEVHCDCIKIIPTHVPNSKLIISATKTLNCNMLISSIFNMLSSRCAVLNVFFCRFTTFSPVFISTFANNNDSFELFIYSILWQQISILRYSNPDWYCSWSFNFVLNLMQAILKWKQKAKKKNRLKIDSVGKSPSWNWFLFILSVFFLPQNEHIDI